MVNKGALVQVTAMSLPGDFGDQVRGTAFRLVKSGLAQVVASDAHSPRNRRPVLSKALRALENLIGPEKARMMVEEILRKILEAEAVEISHTEDQSYRPSLLKKLRTAI